MKDTAGVFRGYCKACGPKSCPESRNDEDGKTRCSYCDCVPLKHVEMETEPVCLPPKMSQKQIFYTGCVFHADILDRVVFLCSENFRQGWV